ncbi:hypothetical protein KAR91_56605 [Candidatus Pacearchaeota archaeon]|nr:hypothetical protein [Candidatus Pacearchaeota archaeon]
MSVTSVHERTWLIAVTTNDHRHIFHVWVVESIPWEYYVGQNRGCRREYSIYSGDNPDQAQIAWIKSQVDMRFPEDE